MHDDIFSIKDINEMEQVSLTPADIEQLAQNTGNEVYINSFEHEFDPWDPLRVQHCVRIISNAIACGSNPPESEELVQFRKLHPTLYSAAKSTEPRVIQFIQTMLHTRMAFNAGKLSQESAAMIILDGIRQNGTSSSES
jgi:hypothetical protein